MQIQIPENLSSRLRQLAARRREPVEKIVEDRLFTALDDELDNLPTDEQAELRALHHLSDDALRAIAAEQMSAENQALMAQLMTGQNKGTLTEAEQTKLAALVERGEQLMLRKAEAAAILVNRGFDGTLAELMNPNG
ncbi:MAG: hypothetical protein CL608_25540 [Anaerolineaceae bacterium]|nr:hypothetical protein [Anaerolineaceae bacterium]